jgi:excinuclease UvrABC helicase subunit UvrB
MSDQEKLYRNLTKLFLSFQNRPQHLAKYLIDKCAFNDFFLKIVEESEKLNSSKIEEDPIFKDIDEMNEYYDIFKEPKGKKSAKKRVEDLLVKLEECLKEEKYEDAARIRDYIIKLGIKLDK